MPWALNMLLRTSFLMGHAMLGSPPSKSFATTRLYYGFLAKPSSSPDIPPASASRARALPVVDITAFSDIGLLATFRQTFIPEFGDIADLLSSRGRHPSLPRKCLSTPSRPECHRFPPLVCGFQTKWSAQSSDGRATSPGPLAATVVSSRHAIDGHGWPEGRYEGIN